VADGERDPTTPADVERLFVQRILDLDASAYRYPRAPPPRWNESNVALTVTENASEFAHLAFNVWTERGLNSGDESGDLTDGYLWVDARLVVAFIFRLRPKSQVEDARLTSDAAIDVLRALLAEWPADQPCIQVQVPPGGTWYQPALTRDGEWAVVTMQFLASFELRLDPSPDTVPPTSTP
jgi:hypothetical protein